jgi:hypothetical protein
VRLSMEEVKNEFAAILAYPGDKTEVKLDYYISLHETILDQRQEIESLKNWNACEADEHDRLVESDKRRIELEEKLERLQKCYHITNKSWKEQIQANKRQERAIRNMKAYMYDKEKELENLKKAVGEWKYEAECHMDEVIARRKENQQLQAQAAVMREALSEAISIITSVRLCSIGSFNNTYSAQISTSSVDKWTKTLSHDAGKDYHNPADLEALKLTLRALRKIQLNNKQGFAADIETKDMILEALNAIARAIGCDPL